MPKKVIDNYDLFSDLPTQDTVDNLSLLPPVAIPHVAIWTDGACKGNPGRGGWGAVIQYTMQAPIELYGQADHTTNNRMELTAAIKALEYLKEPSIVTLYTDSRYICNGGQRWFPEWAEQRTGALAKESTPNRDLWMALYTVAQRHQIQYQWVKGHADNKNNNRADALANLGCKLS